MPAISVFTGPDPKENLKALLNLTPMSRGAVCAVVPDSSSLSAMQSGLADASGGAFLGHRVYTFDSLCQDMLAVDSGGQAPDIINGHVRHAVVSEIVAERIGSSSFYAPIAKTPGFITTVIEYLKETRSHAGKFRVSPLSPIAAAYENHLARLGLTDQEGIVGGALKGHLVERYAAMFKGPFIVSGFYDFTEMQWRLVTRLMRRFHRSSIAIVGDGDRPALFSTTASYLDHLKSMGANVVHVPSGGVSGTDAVLGGFMGSADRVTVDDVSVAIHTFRSESAEASWIAGIVRKLIDDGADPEDIMVVARNGVRYGEKIERAVRIHAIPVERGFIRRFSTYPLPRLVLLALEASIHPEREHLMKAVQGSGLTGSVPSGWKTLLEPMEGKGWSCRIAPVDTPEGFAASLMAMLDDLGVRDNLTGGEKRHLALSEHVSYERFAEILDDFVTCYKSFGAMMRADDFLKRLRSFLSSVSVPDMPSPGRGVLVADANHARFVHRDIVFMTGLDDTAYPSGDTGYSLLDRRLLDKVRKRRKAEDPLLFYMAMAGARRLFLTFPGIDDEGGDNRMSPYLRAIADMIDATVSPEFHPGIAGNAWEGGASDIRGVSELVLRQVCADRKRRNCRIDSLREANSDVAASVEKAFRIHDTRVGTVPVDLSGRPYFKPLPDDTVFPVTGLEQYHRCPVSCFFERGVGLSVDRSSPGDIDAGTRGRILHEALAQFYRDRIDRYGHARFTCDDLPQCRADMRALFARIYGRIAREIDGLHSVPYLTERKYYERWLELFLGREALYFEESGYEPAALEISFGSSRESEHEQIPPFELADSVGGVWIGGRIDRIDEHVPADGVKAVRVVDYKTGTVEAGTGKIEKGENLQIPLYLHATVKLIVDGGDPGEGVYYDMKKLVMLPIKAGRKPIVGQDWHEWFDVAEQKACEAARAMQRGYYPFSKGECSKNCPFYHVCRGGVEELDNFGQ